MDVKAHFTEKLEKLLFLNIKDIYMPVSSKDISEAVRKGEELETIPISYFVYGMFYVLGADENFKYKESYIKYLKDTQGSINYIKGRIAKEIKDENLEDGYILLKGLTIIEKDADILEKAIMVLEELRKKEPAYQEEELEIIEKAKEIKGFHIPYFYEAVIKDEKKDFQGALYALDKFIEISGKSNSELQDFRKSILNNSNYKLGKELVYEDPEKALGLLIPLLEELEEDPTLYFYIGVCYRILENFEKSIYYLNEALRLDSSLVQVVNELGINYASLGDYQSAATYLRKAFEATKSVEICTNLVMCYLNAGMMEDAMAHLELAKSLDPKDDVVLELMTLLENDKS